MRFTDLAGFTLEFVIEEKTGQENVPRKERSLDWEVFRTASVTSVAAHGDHTSTRLQAT